MSLRKIVTTGVLALIGGGVVACVGTEEVSEPPPDPFANQNSFCSQLATAQCNANIVQACYQSADAADTSACVSAAQSPQNCVTSVVDTDAGAGVIYNSTNASACVTEATNAYSDARVTLTEQEALFNVCITVFHRGGTTGQACDFDSDCDTPNGLRCVKKPGGNACAVPVDVAGGEDCSAADAVCPETQYCDAEVGNCLAAPTETEDCGPDVPCAPGLICSGGETDGFCLEKKAPGDECVDAVECESGFCVVASGAPMGTCRADKLYDVAFETCDEFR